MKNPDTSKNEGSYIETEAEDFAEEVRRAVDESNAHSEKFEDKDS